MHLEGVELTSASDLCLRMSS